VFLFLCDFIEFKEIKKNRSYTLNKHIAILSTIFSWVFIFAFAESWMAFTFGVIFAHNITYFIIVWVNAKKGVQKLQGQTILKTCTYFLVYFFGINILAMSINAAVQAMLSNAGVAFFTQKTHFDFLPYIGQNSHVYLSIILGTYFATHANHYFIDTLIWRRKVIFQNN
jgi:hypothetical protein